MAASSIKDLQNAPKLESTLASSYFECDAAACNMLMSFFCLPIVKKTLIISLSRLTDTVYSPSRTIEQRLCIRSKCASGREAVLPNTKFKSIYASISFVVDICKSFYRIIVMHLSLMLTIWLMSYLSLIPFIISRAVIASHKEF